MKKRILWCILAVIMLFSLCACDGSGKVSHVQSSQEKQAKKEKEAAEKKKKRNNDFSGLLLEGHDVLNADFGMTLDELKQTNPNADWWEYQPDPKMFENYLFVYCKSEIAYYDITIQYTMYKDWYDSTVIRFDEDALTPEEAKKLYADLKEYYTKKLGIEPVVEDYEYSCAFDVGDRHLSIWTSESEVEMILSQQQ